MTLQGPSLADNSNPAQIDALTSLRFFAAFYVLVFHSGGPTLVNSGRLPVFAANFLSNGYLGVQFFFVLSGFILARVYYGQLGSDGAIARYGWARFSRVYPVYLLALLLTLPFLNDWHSWHGVPQFVLLQSWPPLGLFSEYIFANSNGPAWTLSAELFFYLLFPWLLQIMTTSSTKAIAVGAGATVLLMLLFRTAAISNIRQALFDFMAYIPVPVLRLPEFVYGSCLGVMFVRGAIPSSPKALGAAAAALVVTLLTSNSLWVAPIAAILAGMIICLVPHSLGEGRVARFLNSRLMVLLGGASFSLYLLQTPVNFWIKYLAGDASIIARVLFIPCLIPISVIVFLNFEEPMRDLLRRGVKRASA